ncbi:stress response protein NST1 isoform X2 [Hyalella azteca]|uniref:Stress response protein NST1 isoform X2 n=1 Tax=Hyalella azteca TaxID=294128 RepID=A0A979FS73_HYAAZ|nr:stress response protein NST1 isoform X2 [Hyalella azteca]
MPDEPGSYVSGVPVRISEAFRPPRKVTLPSSCPHAVDAELLTEEYDVTVETAAISWIEDYHQRKEESANKRQENVKIYRQRKIQRKAQLEEEIKQKEEEDEKRRQKELEEEEERRRLARIEEEKLEIEKERAELARLSEEMLEKEKLEFMRLKNEKLEKERAEKEKVLKEKAEQERMEQINMARLTKESVREKISCVIDTPNANDESVNNSNVVSSATMADDDTESEIFPQDLSVKPTDNADLVGCQDDLDREKSVSRDKAVESSTKTTSFPCSVSNSVADPQLASTSSNLASQAQRTIPEVGGNSTLINFEDFEADRNDPFDRATLQSINDMEELAQVLQSTSVSSQQCSSQTQNLFYPDTHKSGSPVKSSVAIIPGMTAFSNFSQFANNSFYPRGQVQFPPDTSMNIYPSNQFSSSDNAGLSNAPPNVDPSNASSHIGSSNARLDAGSNASSSQKMNQFPPSNGTTTNVYSNILFHSPWHQQPHFDEPGLSNSSQASLVTNPSSITSSSNSILHNPYNSYGYGLPASSCQVSSSNMSAQYAVSSNVIGANLSENLYQPQPNIPTGSNTISSLGSSQISSALPAAPNERPDLEDFYSRYYGKTTNLLMKATKPKDASSTYQPLRSSQSVPDLTALEDQEVSRISDGSEAPVNRPLSSVVPQSRPSSTGPALTQTPLERHGFGPALDHPRPSSRTPSSTNYYGSGPTVPTFSSPTSPSNNYRGFSSAASNINTSHGSNLSNNYGQYQIPGNNIAFVQCNVLNSHPINPTSSVSSYQHINSYSMPPRLPTPASYMVTTTHNLVPLTTTTTTRTTSNTTVETRNPAVETRNPSVDTRNPTVYPSNTGSSSSASSISESNSGFVQSPLELPDPFSELDSEVQSLVCSVAEMGFPRARVARAVQRLGTQHKKLIEVLLELQRLEEEGQEAGRAEVAFYAHLGDLHKTKQHLDTCKQY